MNRVLIAAVLVISPAWIGGVSRPAVYALFAIAVLLFGLNFGKKIRSKEMMSIDFLMLAFAFLSAVAVVQLIPLPFFLFELLSGTSADLISTGGGLLGESPSLHPISLDPSATLDRGLRFYTIALIGTTALNLRGRNVWELYLVAMIGSALLVLAIGIFVNGGSTLFGLETSIRFRGPSPFVNTNHGAAYFGFATLCAAALAQRLWNKDTLKAGVATVFGAVFFVVVLVHDSLGANLIVFGSLIWLLKPKKISDVHTAAVVVSAGSVLVLAWWLGLANAMTSHVLGSTADASNRLELLRSATHAFPDFWVTGSGLGTMEVTIPRYIDWATVNPATIPTLENELAEFFVAIGVWAIVVVWFFVQSFWSALTWHTTFASDGVEQTKTKRRRARVRFVFISYVLAMTLVHFPLFTLGLILPWVIGIAFSNTNDKKLFVVRARTLNIVVIVLGVCLLLNVGYRNTASLLTSAPYITEATKAVNDGDIERATELAEHAWALRPLPQVARYRARVVSLTDKKQAAEIYRFAIDHLPASEALLIDVLTDLKTPELRTIAFAGRPTLQLRVIELVRRNESNYQAIDLAMTMLLENENDTLKNAIFELMLAAGHDDIARAWGTTQRLSDEVLLQFERDLQLADGDWKTTFAQLDAKTTDDAHYLLKNRHRFNDANGLKSGVEQALATWCESPIPPGRRRLCWRNEAWIAEANGELDAATRVLRRIQTRSKDPAPLAKFFKRHHRCKELIELSSDVSARHQKALARITRGCRTIDP